MPNTTNGLLSSPLNGALIGAQQPATYSVPSMLTLQQPAPLTLYTNAPTLPVYGLTHTAPTMADVLALARRIGVEGPVTPTEPGTDGSVAVTVQLGAMPYTLAISAGYGTTGFSLHALNPGVGSSAVPRVIRLADSWLRARNLMRDLYVVDAHDGSVSYGQIIAGLPLLGVTAQLSFDGGGVLCEMSYSYVATGVPSQQAARSPALAADDVVDLNRGLYQGPATATITGTATISSMHVALAGVHGVTGDYLEPIYVLTGTVPTMAGSAPFSLYVPALQFQANIEGG